ncbi:MAG: lyase family protein, partial [Planctomycetes bacterium]|nr:lyase family protein [Planctomycetota bacterium]
MTLGQEFGGYARQVERGVERAHAASEALAELALGGTAVGTGLNCPPGFAKEVIDRVSRRTDLVFRRADDHFEAQGARDAAVEASGAMRTIAVSLMKIANDLRLLGSGPRCGLGEISLPALQPGSSTMPGKVNPVLCESVTQVAAQVIGNDAAIAVAATHGHLELNTFLPVIARNLLESICLLANASALFAGRCVVGIGASRDRTVEFVERSLATLTALLPSIGYDRAAEVAKEAHRSGRTVREVCIELRVLPTEGLDALLDPR